MFLLCVIAITAITSLFHALCFLGWHETPGLAEAWGRPYWRFARSTSMHTWGHNGCRCNPASVTKCVGVRFFLAVCLNLKTGWLTLQVWSDCAAALHQVMLTHTAPSQTATQTWTSLKRQLRSTISTSRCAAGICSSWVLDRVSVAGSVEIYVCRFGWTDN